MKLPVKWIDAYDFGEHKTHGLNSDCENIRDGRIRLVDADGKAVLEDWSIYADDGGLSVSIQDAKEIAESLNNHQQLRELLKEAMTVIKQYEAVAEEVPHLVWLKDMSVTWLTKAKKILGEE